MKKFAEQIGSAVSGVIGLISGVAPHVLHHVGILTSVAIFSGAWGSVLFGVLGLVLALPFFIRLYRRFGTWIAPGIALGVFAGAFLLSTFLIGPAIQDALTARNKETPAESRDASPGQEETTTTSPDDQEEHDGHHPADEKP